MTIEDNRGHMCTIEDTRGDTKPPAYITIALLMTTIRDVLRDVLSFSIVRYRCACTTIAVRRTVSVVPTCVCAKWGYGVTVRKCAYVHLNVRVCVCVCINTFYYIMVVGSLDTYGIYMRVSV